MSFPFSQTTASATSNQKAATQVQIPLDQIHPSQTQIGMAHVQFSIEKILSRNPDLIKAILSRELPCVIGPDAKYYITDGHHWATAAAKLAVLNPDKSPAIRLNLTVLADFRDKSWQEFSDYLYDNKIGYFDQKTRAPYEIISKNGKRLIPKERYLEMIQRHFPKNLLSTEDNALRSLVGIALEEMGIVAEHSLVDYIEFYLGELLDSKVKDLELDKASILKTNRISKETLNIAKKWLATDSAALEFMFNNLRPNLNPEHCKEHLKLHLNDFRAKQLNLASIVLDR